MEPMLIALFPALFIATHLGMASTRSRARMMVSRLGGNWFVALYLYATVWMELNQ